MVCLSAEEYMSFLAAIGRPRARSWAPPTALLLLVYCMGCHTMAITVGAALLPAVVAAQPATAPQLAVTTDGGLSAAPVETTSTFYWLMPGGGGSQSEAGFSWYTRVFSL